MKLWTKMNKRYRRRKFNEAMKILREEANRHIEADHLMQFEAINEAYVVMRCVGCPELTP